MSVSSMPLPNGRLYGSNGPTLRAAAEPPDAEHGGWGTNGGRGLLRVEEAAEWLGLGRTKAYELVYKGVIPSVTIGRSRRIPVHALKTFVDQLVEQATRR